MNRADEQAMLLGSLVGLALATVGLAALVVWWFSTSKATPRGRVHDG